MTIIRPSLRHLPASATVLLAAVVAGCGSSSPTYKTTSTASARAGSRAALATCLRQHGVNLPAGRAPGAGGGPPAGGTGGGTGSPPTGGAPSGGFPGGGGAGNSKLQAALKACGANFRPGGGPRPGFTHTTIQKYVTCVRSHGYNLPNPNFSGKGAIFPSSIRSNPKFQAASKSCQSLLAPSRAGGGSNSA
jgi:hypothetical protein